MITLAPWNPKYEGTTWGAYHAGLSLLTVVERARADGHVRVMLTGPCPPREWYLGAMDQWQATRVFLDHELPAAKYVHTDGHAVEVRRAAEWFGDGDYTHTDARTAWAATGHALTTSGQGGAAMFRSPGATGLDLWLRCSGGVVPEPLPDDIQEQIRVTTPQHRIEIFPPTQPVAPAMWVIDGRWQYAALVRELGAGPARRLLQADAEELARDEYARARYLVTWRAPDWWQETHLPGLLLASTVDGWRAPLTGTAWVDASELQLARRYDWQCEVREAIAYTKARPLDTWGARLIRARDKATPERYGANVAPLVARAIRSVLLHAVGSWHARGRDEIALTASPMQIPDGAGWMAPEPMPDGQAMWRRRAPEPTARQRAMRHPEWSAGIWGRAHARILESPTSNGRRAGALAVRGDELVSIYGDAIVTTKRPTWADLDDGKPGRLRVKGHICGPIKWPTTARERDQISRTADANGTTCERCE